MLRIQITSAAPGMTLAADIPGAAGAAAPLLRAGYRLTGSCIEKLRELKVRRVWVRFPRLDGAIESAAEETRRVQDLAANVMEDAVREVGAAVAPRLDYVRYDDVIRKLAEQVRDDTHAGMLVGELQAAGTELAAHSAAVSFLALLLGVRLDAYLQGQRRHVGAAAAKHVQNLGLGGLLHDVGLLRLEPALRAAGERSPAGVFGAGVDKWRAHAEYGREMVHDYIAPTASAAIAHHHQRCDRSGFPSGAREDQPAVAPGDTEIHIFARIVAVADAFDAARRWDGEGARGRKMDEACHEVGGTPMVRTMSRLIARGVAGEFDGVVTRALGAIVPPFAPGSVIELSTGAPAVVLEHNPRRPCRPRVQRIRCLAALARLEDDCLAEVIDLARERDISVAASEGAEVGGDLYELYAKSERGMSADASAGSDAGISDGGWMGPSPREAPRFRPAA
ncbi:cyclic di-GMP phosphodiesterase [soil metagenome]